MISSDYLAGNLILRNLWETESFFPNLRAGVGRMRMLAAVSLSYMPSENEGISFPVLFSADILLKKI